MPVVATKWRGENLRKEERKKSGEEKQNCGGEGGETE